MNRLKNGLFTALITLTLMAALIMPQSAVAVATTSVIVSNSAWTLLGPGPLQVTSNVAIAYAISDAAPSIPSGGGFKVSANQIFTASTTSNVYALATGGPTATLWIAPVSAGGGGGGGAATLAPGSVSAGAYLAGSLVDGASVTMGTEADAPWSGTGSATEIAILKKLATAPAGNVFQATNFATGTASAAGTTQVFPLSGSTTIYLVNYAYQTDAGATGNGTFQIISGTGTNCLTVHNTLTPTWNFAQNAGIAEGSIGVLGASQAGDALCVVTTASVKVNWRIGIAQQ